MSKAKQTTQLTPLEPLSWHTEQRQVKALDPDPDNPRRATPHGQKQLGGSLTRFGLVEIPVCNADGRLIAGHRRVEWLLEQGRGDELIDVRVPCRQLTRWEATEYELISNRHAGEWDWAKMGEVEPEIAKAAGFTDEELKIGFESIGTPDRKWPENPPDDAEPQNNRAAELAAKWGVKTGQIWKLGEHRLMCGDSRSAEDTAAVMGDESAHCCWTDPPYGVNYKGKTRDALEIEGDSADGLVALLASVFSGVDVALEPGGAIYVAHPAGALSLVFDTAFVAAGWRLHQTLVWLKDSMVLGHSDYHFKHEPITFGYKSGAGRRGRGGQGWYGDNSQTSVLEFARPKRSEEHPTMKPVELVEACLRNSSPSGGIIYEPFSGSGTTIIACERLGRRCRAIEIDPGYVAVAIQRWADTTGGKPELA